MTDTSTTQTTPQVPPGLAFLLSLHGDKGGLAFVVDGGLVSILQAHPGLSPTEPLPVLGQCNIEHLTYVARQIVAGCNTDPTEAKSEFLTDDQMLAELYATASPAVATAIKRHGASGPLPLVAIKQDLELVPVRMWQRLKKSDL